MGDIHEKGQYSTQMDKTLKTLFPEGEPFESDVIIGDTPLKIGVGILPTETALEFDVDVKKSDGGNGRVNVIFGMDENGSVHFIHPFTSDMRKIADSLFEEKQPWHLAKKIAAVQTLKTTQI